MKKLLLITGLVASVFILSSCGDAPPAPTNKIDPAKVDEAKGAQGGVKAQNGGGVFQADDGPPKPGEKTGAHQVLSLIHI